MGADPLWIRSERPQLHNLRTLNYGATSIRHERRLFIVSPDVGQTWSAESGRELTRILASLYCIPTPTPEDLAWLRGAK
jgi:hypothetical protein